MFTFSGEQGAGTQRRKGGKSTEEGKAYTRSKISTLTLLRVCDKETWSRNQYFSTEKIETTRLEPPRKRKGLSKEGRGRGKFMTPKGQAEVSDCPDRQMNLT